MGIDNILLGFHVAITFDGYPLARKGQGAQALTAAFTSSFVGALFATILITLFAPLLANLALKFGPPEFFAIQTPTYTYSLSLRDALPLAALVARACPHTPAAFRAEREPV